jgi:Fe-S-cluster containining protein
MKKTQKNRGGLLRRLHFPEEEKRLPWLPMLLEAYAIADTGISVALRDAEKKQKKKLACGKGCGNCCEHQKDLPLYPHELVGIYWYVSEKLPATTRDALKSRLATHTADTACPFLVDGSCSIHPLRPIGCRQFNVFTMPCAPGEDPYYTRRDDVLVPVADYTDRAFAAVLPFYNMKMEGDLSQAIKLIRSQILNLQTFNWGKLVAMIEQTGSRSSDSRSSD